MKQNLVVFLADLFNVLEIHPVKCVRFPGTDKSLKEGKTLFFSVYAGKSNTFSFTGAII
jgi:hypothetical protein